MRSDYSARNTASPAPGAVLLPIDRIETSPLNPRKRFDDEDLQRLAESLEADGLLQPIVVTPAGERFVVVAGERRLRAAQLLNWTEIPAIERTDVDDRTLVRLALLENLARSDLDPLEEAEGYRALQDLGMTQAEIAAAVHRSQPAIANALRLLKAPEEVRQRMLQTGADGKPALAPSHVLALLKYEAFPQVMIKLGELAAEQRTPSKALEGGLASMPWEFAGALRDSKLAQEVSEHRAAFDVKVCQTACPFGAYAKAQYSAYCLRPEHYNELQKAGLAKRRAETKAQIAESAPDNPDGSKPLQLKSLKYGAYERLDWGGGVPKGCSPKCECRRGALDGKAVVQICLKPAHLRELRDTARKAEEAARLEQQRRLAEACAAALDKGEGIRSRELALLAVDALGQVREQKLIDQILTKHASAGFPKRGARSLDDLAKLQPAQLVKIAVEALLANDLYEMKWGHHKPAYATWYAGPLSSAAKPKPDKPTRKEKKASEKAVNAARIQLTEALAFLEIEQYDNATIGQRQLLAMRVINAVKTHHRIGAEAEIAVRAAFAERGFEYPPEPEQPTEKAEGGDAAA